MPCYQVNIISVFFKPENKNLLQKAAKSMKWTVVEIAGGYRLTTTYGKVVEVDLVTGKTTGDSNSVNSLRLVYARTAVQQVKEWAKQKGWTAEVKGDNKLTLRKGL